MDREKRIRLRLKLQTFMKEWHLSQKDVGLYTGLSQAVVSYILSGARLPSEEVVEKVEEMFKFFNFKP